MEVNEQELNLILTAINCYFICDFEPQCVGIQEKTIEEKKQMIVLRDRIEGVLGGRHEREDQKNNVE